MSKIVVVDLDGSLVSVNSFRLWLLFSFVFLFFSFRWFSLWDFMKTVVNRLLRRIDRVEMKKNILKSTEQFPEFFVIGFVKVLLMFINKSVLIEMRKYDGGQYDLNLCTAAPFFYADKIAKKLGFSQVFSTPSVFVSKWKENIKSEKVLALEAFYGEGFTIECVITDHHDDLPLLLKANRKVLVSPSDVTLEKISGLFEFEVI